MKALLYKEYGSPRDILHLEEVEKPSPDKNEVLIKVENLSINPSELHKLSPPFWLLRLSTGLFKPNKPILGADIAGTIVEIGSETKHLKKGDRVFGRCSWGGLAEFCCLESSSIAQIPDGVSFEHAATLPLASVTALIALRDKGKIQPGQNILINGASGGIGTFAVQMAKNYGCTVTCVCSAANLDLVKSLGGHHVIDYTTTDFTTTSARYDLIVDLVGNRNIRQLARALKRRGTCVLVGMSSPNRLFGNMIKGLFISMLGRKKVVPMDAQITSNDLADVANQLADGKISPVIEKKFDFEFVPDAFAHIASKRTKGKVLIKI